MRYDKLIRDKIPEIIEKKGETAKIHIAAAEEYEEKLFEKLLEESKELTKSRTMEELADVLEVLEAIKKLKGFSDKEITKIKEKKFGERGGFEKRIILEES